MPTTTGECRGAPEIPRLGQPFPSPGAERGEGSKCERPAPKHEAAVVKEEGGPALVRVRTADVTVVRWRGRRLHPGCE
jgi:hypothetical protein